MNTKLLKLALDSGLINYVDNETPRVYFICGHADIEEVEKFAELIVQECAELCLKYAEYEGLFNQMEFRKGQHFNTIIKNHFGVEE